MKKSFKNFISFLLIFAIFISALPTAVFASVKDLVGNTNAENNEILAMLSELTGGRGEETYALLKNLGLLDENGELKVDQSINLDGRNLTLDEVMTLLDDPATDLSRIASVDGAPIALGDLKTIIQIEQELARIQATYFSDKTFTQEQLTMLDGLLNQIEIEGINATFVASATAGSLPVITITPSGNASNPLSIDSTQLSSTVTQTFNLSLSGNVYESTNISFSWKVLKGLLEDIYVDDEEDDNFGTTVKFVTAELKINNEVIDEKKQAISLTLPKTDTDTNIGTLTLTFDYIIKNSQYLYGLSGSLKGFVEMYDAQGFVFSDGTDVKDSYTLPFTVSKPWPFETNSEWATMIKADNPFAEPLYFIPSTLVLVDIRNTPRWNLLNPVDNSYSYSDFMHTAREVYPTDGTKPVYDIRTYLSIIDSAMTTTAGYMHMVKEDFSIERGNIRDITNSLNGGSTGGYIPVYRGEQEGQNNPATLDITCQGDEPLPTLSTVNGKFLTSNNSADTTSFQLSTAALAQTGAGTMVSSYSSYLGIHHGESDTYYAYPKIVSIKIPDGEYSTGQYVPIYIEFSQPVVSSSINDLSMKINGVDILSEDLGLRSTGRKAVAYYKVKDIADSSISISEIRNIRSLSFTNYKVNPQTNKDYITQIENKGGSGWEFTDVKLKSALMKNAVIGFSLSKSYIVADATDRNIEVSLVLK